MFAIQKHSCAYCEKPVPWPKIVNVTLLPPPKTSPQQRRKTFKERRSLAMRKIESSEILTKFPKKVPVIVEKSEREKVLPYLDRVKFLVPLDMTMSQFVGIVRYMVRDVTNHLYQPRGNQSGLDLASLNINRGRDHGIPGYTKLVEFCGGPTITTFSQLDRLFQRGVRPLFQRLYEDVRDIDLFSGGLAERPNQGAVIGPTFTCIIGLQFYHLKYGDRFYFEHGGLPTSFSAAQLREIKKMTLAKLICQNSDIDDIQPNVMLYPSARNPVRSCDELPEMDLAAWRQS